MAAGRSKQARPGSRDAADGALAVDPRAASDSLDERRFAELAAEVERWHAMLAQWQERRAAFDRDYLLSIVPLWHALQAVRTRAAEQLERQLAASDWTRSEQAQLRGHIARLRHAAGEAGDEPEATAPDNAADAADAIGLEATGFDEADFARRSRQREADAQARRDARRERRAADAARKNDPDAQDARRSLREVFRRVASVLHPDRELDPERRDAKTALMQQANRAYEEHDLLALLELQGDAGGAAAAAAAVTGDPAQRKARERLLEAGLRRLRDEVDRVEAGMRADLGLPPGRGMKPSRLGLVLRDEARALREAIAAQGALIDTFADAHALRLWLRAAGRPARDDRPRR